MKKTRIVAGIVVVAFTNLRASQVQADTFPNFYVGGAVGEAKLSDNESPFGFPPLGFSAHHVGWKLLAGIRPIKLVGAEIEYLDFGHPSGLYNETFSDVRARAKGAFGLLYLPLPVPILDIYAKAGIARSQIAVNAHEYAGCSEVVGPGAPPCIPEYFYYRDRTAESFAYGAGVQAKLSSFAIRAEYERVDVNIGKPSLLSLGVTWTF